MQSRAIAHPKLTFMAHPAITQQKILKEITFNCFLDWSRLSMSEHRLKTAKSLCEADPESHPATIIGIL